MIFVSVTVTWLNGTHVVLEENAYNHIDGLVQERRNSSALAMELRLFWH